MLGNGTNGTVRRPAPEMDLGPEIRGRDIAADLIEEVHAGGRGVAGRKLRCTRPGCQCATGVEFARLIMRWDATADMTGGAIDCYAASIGFVDANGDGVALTPTHARLTRAWWLIFFGRRLSLTYWMEVVPDRPRLKASGWIAYLPIDAALQPRKLELVELIVVAHGGLKSAAMFDRLCHFGEGEAR